MSMQFINVVTKSSTSSSPTSFLAKRLFSAFYPNQSNESGATASTDPEGSNFKSFKDYRDTVQVAGQAPFGPAKAKEEKLSETEKEKDELSKQAKEVEYKNK